MWAAIAKKAADAPAPSTAPRERVVAPSTEDVAPLVAEPLTTEPLKAITLPTPVKGAMVLDTNAFINETGLERYTALADVLVTTASVIQECKDKKTREFLSRLPTKLLLLEPSAEAIKEVAEMSELTGDFGALSRTDIRVCALALECARHLGAMKPRIQPRGASVNPSTEGIAVVTEEQEEEDEESSASDAESEDGAPAPAPDDPDERRRLAAAAAWGGGASWDDTADDGEGEWITPANIAKVRAHDAGETTAFGGGFACATSDFPMQNTLLHLGVPIVGPRGMMVTELRQWLLRCHACFRLVHDTTKQFCPDCGSGDTLRRVNYVVDSDGNKKLFINFKRKISTRGTIFALPKPRGGRRGTNKTLALREDQLANCGAVSARMKIDRAVEEDALASFGEVKRHRKHDPDKPREKSSYKKGNVNEAKKARAGRRK